MASTVRRRLGPACRGLLAAVLTSIACPGCGQERTGRTDVQVVLRVAPDPPRTGPGDVTLQLMTALGEPLSGAQVRLEGNMSHPGMRPSLAEATEIEPGRYRGTIDFTMAGDWFIVVHAELPDGRGISEIVKVPGVGAG